MSEETPKVLLFADLFFSSEKAGQLVLADVSTRYPGARFEHLPFGVASTVCPEASAVYVPLGDARSDEVTRHYAALGVPVHTYEPAPEEVPGG